jgi:hypothetical protein
VISDKFVDVDHTFSGWIDSDEDRTYGAAFPDELLVDRSEWRDRIEERKKAQHSLQRYHPYVYNQKPESCCVYCSAAGCLTIRRNLSLGNSKQVVLSPLSGYARVATSRHSGSTMWGALEQCREVGLLPSDKHSKDYPHTFRECTPFAWPRAFPDGWRETAKLFRCTEWCRIDSRTQFASAVLGDMPVCYGRSGHSICAEDLLWHEGRFVVSYCDSYSKNRGDNGRLYDTERYWATGGAWACRVVTLPEDSV